MPRSKLRERSSELVEAAYFMSRFTENAEQRVPQPPRELNVGGWAEAYDCFFPKLSAGRSLLQFRNTLKNSRDEFDGYFENGRTGWKESDGRPRKLSGRSHEVYEALRSIDRDKVWARVQRYI
jgi:hypothetical protein